VPDRGVSEGPFLIVGLGNPGPGYAGNRHNVGAMVLDELAGRAGIRLSAGKGPRSRALAGEGRLVGRRVVLARPLTYMNESGGPVRGLLDYHHLPAEDLVVVHDELDLPFATVRLKRGGGEGGHNGLRSISRSTGTKDYLRVRVGIGRPPGRQDPADYVLKDFSSVERKELDLLVAEAADAAEALLIKGLEGAQNEVHPRS
jgi:PTH1 family peptidyl-tRNA hydrolase